MSGVGPAAAGFKTYVVEHLDPELGPWSTAEYLTIAKESHDAGSRFCLCSVSKDLDLPAKLENLPALRVEQDSAEALFKQDRVCLLDPAAQQELSPSDGDLFNVFLFGGILDRTSELRKKGYQGRRLGPKQMTTDTAVRVTRIVIQDKISLNQIPYLDDPELKIDEHESTEMPFRYVRGSDGQPVMPEGMLELIKEDADKGFGDLL